MPLGPRTLFALQLALGVLVLTGAAAVFGEIAEDVLNGEMVRAVDLPVTAWLLAHAWAPLTRFLLWLTYAHGIAAVTAYAALLAVWLAAKRQYYWLLALVLAVPGGTLVNALMKLAFARARPDIEHPLLTLQTYSFPSGHTAGATLFYGFAAVWLLSRTSSWRLRAAIPAAACLMVLLVAFSRVYLGAHYVTDVAAAMAEGVAWLAFCLSAVHVLRVRGQSRKALVDAGP